MRTNLMQTRMNARTFTKLLETSAEAALGYFR
jgi:hypothetical protein